MRQKTEPIGKIVIDVYPNGHTEAKLTGDIPVNAITMCKIPIQKGYRQYIQDLGVRERQKKLEGLRVQKQEALAKVEDEAKVKAEEYRLQAEKEAKEKILEGVDKEITKMEK